MKLKHFALPFLAVPVLAAPPAQPVTMTDEALLRAVQQRNAEMKLLTPEPMLLMPRTSLLCRPPTQAELKKDAEDPHLNKYARVLVTPGGEAAATGHEAFHPPGTVLLKEKLPAVADPDKKGEQKAGKDPELFTGMLKREKGFNPAAADWEFFTVSGDGTKMTSRGRLDNCTRCHSSYQDQDFVTRMYVPQPLIEADAAGTVVLHAKDAQVYGKSLRYEPKPEKNTLGYWTEAADYAEWRFRAPPGTYSVEVLQGCGKGSGGAEVAIAVGEQAVTFTVEDTGHFQNFKAREVGKLKINGSQSLSVTPKTKPGVAVMDLRQVVLKRTGD